MVAVVSLYPLMFLAIAFVLWIKGIDPRAAETPEWLLMSFCFGVPLAFLARFGGAEYVLTSDHLFETRLGRVRSVHSLRDLRAVRDSSLGVRLAFGETRLWIPETRGTMVHFIELLRDLATKAGGLQLEAGERRPGPRLAAFVTAAPRTASDECVRCGRSSVAMGRLRAYRGFDAFFFSSFDELDVGVALCALHRSHYRRAAIAAIAASLVAPLLVFVALPIPDIGIRALTAALVGLPFAWLVYRNLTRRFIAPWGLSMRVIDKGEGFDRVVVQAESDAAADRLVAVTTPFDALDVTPDRGP